MTEENRQELSKLCEVIRQTVAAREIYLFGSYAYGTPHEDSDYDLYVVIPDDGPRPIAAMKDLNVALHKHCRKALDILVAKESRFSGRVNAPTLERTVKEKGMLLYSGPAGHDMENPTGVSVQKKEQSEQDGGMELNKYPETGLPGYLQHDLDAYEEGLQKGSSLLDCLWCELYSSINAAQIDDGAITSEHAKYLRKKFLHLDVEEAEKMDGCMKEVVP